MRIIRILCCLILLVALVACGVDNTMYNARKYFTSANTKPLNTNGKPNAQAIEEYTKCIQKCGVIISRSKKSARVDDAVFLMAKALYYKGNSAFQAKDQFENLIKGFPKSPYVPEAHIYIARVLRDINQPKDAEKQLDTFIRDPRFVKEHPQALLLLAEFSIKDKDYTRAQFWLDKIIREYPKTKEFKEAYFLFGKNYYEQKEFATSRDAFYQMRGSRRVGKAMKLDASYYIALNNLELGEIDAALKEIKSLAKAENRPEKMSLVRVLQARILMADKQYPKALTELEYVTKNYPRTEGAGAAYFFLGEYYYYYKSDISVAITNYNRVRTEYSTSVYATPGQEKATALGSVSPRADLDAEKDLKQFTEFYYQAAESFAGVLALPDSAVACYYKVMAERDSLIAIGDSLSSALVLYKVQRDSLQALVAADSLEAKTTMDLPAVPDSLLMVEHQTSLDSLSAVSDSTMMAEVADSLKVDNQSLLKDLDAKISAAESRQTQLHDLLESFEAEIVPFCMFAIGSLKHKLNMPAESETVYNDLHTAYPNSKYSKAMYALINDQPIKLIDPLVEEQQALLDSLLGEITVQPDSAVTKLDMLTASPVPEVQLAANYRLGWFYSFEQPDTLKAASYLQAVLDNPQSGDYGAVINRFYNGKRFLLWDPPAADSISKDVPDSLIINIDDKTNPADSLKFELSLPDSLQQFITPVTADSLIDSLQVLSEPVPAPPQEEPKQLDTEPQAPAPTPDIIKDEEPKLE